MATKTVYFGSLGPFSYDDATFFAVNTTGQMKVDTAPTDPTHVLRKSDTDTFTKQSHITHLTDGTGGTANDTLTALGGITILTDSSGGTANNTVQALTDPVDTPLTADALRDDLVANIIPELRNNFADVSAKINALIADMNDARDNLADVTAKLNALLTSLEAAGVLA